MSSRSILMAVLGSSVLSQANSTDQGFFDRIFAESCDEQDASVRFRKDYLHQEPLYVSHECNRSYLQDVLRFDQIRNPGSLLSKPAWGVREQKRISFTVGGNHVSIPITKNISQDTIPEKHSFVLRFETMNSIPDEINRVKDQFQSENEKATSIHGYYSAAGGAKALNPHTDPYDVIVMQVAGSKSWTTCVPNIDPHGNLNSAQYASEFAREYADGHSCVTYEVEDFKEDFKCNTILMEAGDVLYIPKDIIHFATTLSESSLHLTIGMGKAKSAPVCGVENEDFVNDVIKSSRRRRDSSCDCICDGYYGTSCDGCCDYYEDCDDDDDYDSCHSWRISSIWWAFIVAGCCFFGCCGFYWQHKKNQRNQLPPRFDEPVAVPMTYPQPQVYPGQGFNNNGYPAQGYNNNNIPVANAYPVPVETTLNTGTNDVPPSYDELSDDAWGIKGQKPPSYS